MTKIVILNGPGGCGKDFLGSYLLNRIDTQLYQFKNQLLTDVVEYFNVSQSWFESVYNNRETKEAPLVEFGGKSPREATIFVSEEIMKPRHGNLYYGQHVAGEILTDSPEIAIISDGGVVNDGEWLELSPLIDIFGKENILIVQLYRKGCSFDGDSRRYFGEPNLKGFVLGSALDVMGVAKECDVPLITPNVKGVDVTYIFNNGSLQDLYDAGDKIVGNFKRSTLK